MAFYGCSSLGTVYDDGNDITYPIISPTTNNKLYKEFDVDRIAVVLGQELKLSEMPDAVQVLVNSGIRHYHVIIRTVEIENITPLEVES